jgi:hypothetical protein
MVTPALEAEVNPDVATTAQLKHCARCVWALQSSRLLTILGRLLGRQIFCDVYKEQTQAVDPQVRAV